MKIFQSILKNNKAHKHIKKMSKDIENIDTYETRTKVNTSNEDQSMK